MIQIVAADQAELRQSLEIQLVFSSLVNWTLSWRDIAVVTAALHVLGAEAATCIHCHAYAVQLKDVRVMRRRVRPNPAICDTAGRR